MGETLRGMTGERCSRIGAVSGIAGGLTMVVQGCVIPRTSRSREKRDLAGKSALRVPYYRDSGSQVRAVGASGCRLASSRQRSERRAPCCPGTVGPRERAGEQGPAEGRGGVQEAARAGRREQRHARARQGDAGRREGPEGRRVARPRQVDARPRGAEGSTSCGQEGCGGGCSRSVGSARCARCGEGCEADAREAEAGICRRPLPRASTQPTSSRSRMQRR